MKSQNQLYLQTAGDRQQPAIVFLHGGGLSGRQWEPQIEALKGQFYCLAPDLAEQGQSSQVKPFDLAEAARQVAAMIAELPAKRAHIVGLSLGGAVALELARTMPEQVNHLIVSGTSAGLSNWLGQLTIASAGMYRWFGKNTLLNMAYQQFHIPQMYRDKLRADLLLGFDVDFTRHFTKALMNVHLPGKAHALVVVGEKETFVAKSDARKLVAQIQGAQGAIAPGVGHVWNLEAPELFSSMVRAFVSGAALPSELRPLS